MGRDRALGILLRIAAIYTALAGLGFILAPVQLGAEAVPPDASPELVAHLRVLISPLLGIAVLDWAARNAEPCRARDAILLGNVMGFAAIGAMDVWSQLSGGRGVTLVFAVVHLLFALAFLWAWRTSGTRSLSRRAQE